MAPRDITVSAKYETLVHMREPGLIFVPGPRRAYAGTRKRERERRLEHRKNQPPCSGAGYTSGEKDRGNREPEGTKTISK